MSERANGTQAGAFCEAPASWNTRYLSTTGFECQLTLRGADPVALLKLANELMSKMAEAGIKPANGHRAQPVAVAGEEPADVAGPMCPTHNKPMKPSKFGGWYCGVKVADDDGTGKPVYCRQKSK